MAEANAVKKEKAPRVEQVVTMSDGRSVTFVGKRKMLKETLIDESKLQVTGDGVLVKEGAVVVRIDFLNGKTLSYTPPLSLIAKAAGHGLEQKLGDQAAGEADVDDAQVSIEDLMGQLDKGEWTSRREGDGFAGASIVVRAIMEASGKTQEEVKAFLAKLIEDSKAKGAELSRKDLYDSFRRPGTKTGDIVARMEKEKVQKAAKVDADEALAGLL